MEWCTCSAASASTFRITPRYPPEGLRPVSDGIVLLDPRKQKRALDDLIFSHCINNFFFRDLCRSHLSPPARCRLRVRLSSRYFGPSPARLGLFICYCGASTLRARFTSRFRRAGSGSRRTMHGLCKVRTLAALLSSSTAMTENHRFRRAGQDAVHLLRIPAAVG